MTTTAKWLLSGIALTMCGNALAAVTVQNTTNHPTIEVGKTGHTIVVPVALLTPPITISDVRLNQDATSGQSLGRQAIIATASFTAAANHKYVLGTETDDAVADKVHYSFSDDRDSFKGADFKWLTGSAVPETAYVMLTKDLIGALTPGLHNYTFLITDYSA